MPTTDEQEVLWDVENLEGHVEPWAATAPAGVGVSRAEAAIAMVRIFGAFLVVVGLALLAASLLQGLGGN